MTKMKKIVGSLIGVMLLLFIVGCSNTEQMEMFDAGNMEGADMNVATDYSVSEEGMEEEAALEKVELDTEIETEERGSAVPEGMERMIIYTGDMEVEVESYDEAEQQLTSTAQSLGGFIVESSKNEHEDGHTSGYLVARVPQERLDDFVQEVKETSLTIHYQQSSGSDVTEEYVDLEARLKSKRVMEERLITFLEEADSTENLLKVSNDLGKVQEEIEQLVGRMNYLEDRVRYASMTISIRDRGIEVGSLQGQNTLNTWANAKKLFMDTTNGIIAFFSGLVVLLIGFSPILFPLVVIAVVMIILVRRKKKMSTPPVQEE